MELRDYQAHDGMALAAQLEADSNWPTRLPRALARSDERSDDEPSGKAG